MVIEFKHQLFLRSNLFHGFCKYCDLHDDFFLFVCLFVFVSLCAGYLKLWTDSMKFCGQVGCVTRTNWLDFGEDPYPDPTTRIF